MVSMLSITLAQSTKVQIGTSSNNSFAVASMGRLNSNQWYVSAYLNSAGNSIILNLRQENGSTSNTSGVTIQNNSVNHQILDLVPLAKGKVALIYIENNRRIMGSIITATTSSMTRTTPELIRTTGGDVYMMHAIRMTYVTPHGGYPSTIDLALNYHSSDYRYPYLAAIRCFPNGGQYGYFSTLDGYKTIEPNGGDLSYLTNIRNAGITPNSLGRYAPFNSSKIERLDNNSLMVMVWSSRFSGMVRFEKWDLDFSRSAGIAQFKDYNSVTAHYDENIDENANYKGAILPGFFASTDVALLAYFDMVKNGNTLHYVIAANSTNSVAAGGNFFKQIGGRKNFIYGKIALDAWGNIVNPQYATTDRGQFTGTWVDANIDGSTSVISPSIVSAGGGTSVRLFYGKVTGTYSNSNITGRSGFMYLQLPFWSGMQDGPTNILSSKKTGYAGYLNRATHHQDSETDYINIYKENTSNNRIYVSF